MVHMVLGYAFLNIWLTLSGFHGGKGIRGRIGDGMFWLAFAMMYPAALLRDLHIPTLADLPLWEGSLGDYFAWADLPLGFLNSVFWGIVVYQLWNRYRARRTPSTGPS